MPNVRIKCDACGVEFERQRHHAKRSRRHFCSQGCYGTRRHGEDSPRWNGGTVEVACWTCGKMMKRRASCVKKHKRLFCSTKCYGIGQRTAVELTCDGCGAKFKRQPSLHKYDHQYCSVACASVSRMGANNSNWGGGTRRRGKYMQVKSPDHPLRGRDGYVYLHRLIVEDALNRYLWPWELVHHVDWDKENNAIDNLVVVTRTEHNVIHHPWDAYHGRGRYSVVGIGHGKKRNAHRVAIESVLGRKIARTEKVHHRNGDRANNAPWNLRLFDGDASHRHYHNYLNKTFFEFEHSA